MTTCPSFAAIKLSKERALGRELTATEAKLLKNSTNVMAVPHSVHKTIQHTKEGIYL